jgi:hypothetical protein
MSNPTPDSQDALCPTTPPPRWSWVRWTIIICGSLAVLALVGYATWEVPSRLCPSIKLENRALLGDAFGLAGAVFSAMALLGVVLAVLIQSHELRHQQYEVRQTVNALRDQHASMRRQEIEGHFFQLLAAIRQVVADTSFTSIRGDKTRGRAAFGAMLESFRAFGDLDYVNKHPAAVVVLNTERHADLMSKYRRWYQEKSSDQLGHFFRLLYHTVLYVHDQELPVEVRKHYIRLIRAHLSDPELVLLAYNCLTPTLGFEQFYPLVERYRVLANVAVQDLLDPKDIEFFPRNWKAINPNASTTEEDLLRMFGLALLPIPLKTFRLDQST